MIQPAFGVGMNSKQSIKRPSSTQKVHTRKTDSIISSKDQTELLETLVKSVIDEKTFNCLKGAVKFVTNNQLVCTETILPLLTKFLATSSDPMIPNKADSVRIQIHQYYTVFNRKIQLRYDGENSQLYKKSSRTVLDTKRNYASSKKRKHLRAGAGFNQKLILIMDQDSYVSYHNLFKLTECHTEIIKAEHFYGKYRKNSYSQILPGETPKVEYQKIQCHSIVRYFVTQLFINNDSKAYKAYLKVHLVSFKNYRNCLTGRGTLTTQELIDCLFSEIKDPTRKSMKNKEIIFNEMESQENNKFMKKILVEPYTSITDSQIIKDNVDIIETYYLELKPSEKGIITVRHNFTKGIDLYDLKRYSEGPKDCDMCLEAPALTFFIIEGVGSSNAEILEIKDRDNRYNGSAPIKLRLEETIDMHFKRIKNEPTDVPASVIFMEDDRDFIDKELSEMFSPAKQTAFNVNIELIDVDGTNPDAKWMLSQDQNSLVSYAESLRHNFKDPSISFKDAQILLNQDNGINEESAEDSVTLEDI